MKLFVLLLLALHSSPSWAQCPTDEDVCSMPLADLEAQDFRGSLTGSYLYLGNIEDEIYRLGEQAGVEFIRLDTEFHLANRTVKFEVRGSTPSIVQFTTLVEAYRVAAGLYY